MNTEVIMKRDLFGEEIGQKSKSEFFSATDLVRAGNRWRVENGLEVFNLSVFMQNKSTKEFMLFLEKEYGAVKINAKAKGQHTWVHPFLFIKIALAISPQLEIKVYQWLYDELLKYRNNSGDSYKKMTGSIYLALKNKSNFKEALISAAQKIKKSCGVKDWNTATEEQLKKRDRIHDSVSIICDILHDVNQAVDISIKRIDEGK